MVLVWAVLGAIAGLGYTLFLIHTFYDKLEKELENTYSFLHDMDVDNPKFFHLSKIGHLSKANIHLGKICDALSSIFIVLMGIFFALLYFIWKHT